MTKTYVKDYTNTFEIKGETIEVTAPARFDSKTNKIIDDMELDNRAIKMAQNKYRKKFNVIGPIDIKALRKKWNLTPNVARLLFFICPDRLYLIVRIRRKLWMKK